MFRMNNQQCSYPSLWHRTVLHTIFHSKCIFRGTEIGRTNFKQVTEYPVPGYPANKPAPGYTIFEMALLGG